MKQHVCRGLITLFLLGGQGEATTYPKKPTMQDLAKAWVGVGPSGYELYRLELNEDGTGLLTSTWGEAEETTAYRVVGTSLSGYKLQVTLVPTDPKQTPPYLRGQATASRLDLEIGDKKTEWKSRMYFRPQTSLLAGLKAVTERANNERFK